MLADQLLNWLIQPLLALQGAGAIRLLVPTLKWVRVQIEDDREGFRYPRGVVVLLGGKVQFPLLVADGDQLRLGVVEEMVARAVRFLAIQ